MRSKEQRDVIINKLMENFRKHYGSYKTVRGHYKQRDEWEDSAEVKRHNDQVARMREREKRKKESRERLKKNNIVPKKQGKPMYEDKNNTLASKQVLGKSLAGQTFYIVCPDDSRYYKTVYMRFNPFTNAIQPMMSNPIYGGKEDAENIGLSPIHPTTLQRMMRLQQTTTFMDF